MKKFHIASSLALLLFMGSCSNDENQILEDSRSEIDQKTALTTEEINSYIATTLENQGTFDWKDTSDHFLWSAAVHGGNILTIGYGDESFNETKSSTLSNTKNEILETILSYEPQLKNNESQLIYEDEVLNFIDVKVTTLALVTELRKNQEIRYIEPEGYVYNIEQTKSSSGCSQSGESISSSDYGTTSLGAKIPWNFYDANINQAFGQVYSKIWYICRFFLALVA